MAEYGLSTTGALNRAGQPEKLVTLVLLFILLTAAAAGVTSVLISPDWGSLWRGLFFGLLFGWGMAVLRQPAWRSALVTMTIGTVYTLLFTGGLRDKAAAILVELTSISNRLAASRGYPSADLTALGELQRDLVTDALVVMDRVRLWLTALVSGEGGFDPIAAALVWSIMVWLVAAWAGWVVEARRNALLAALPAVMLCLGTLSYGQYESLTLYVMLAALLLLLATVQHDHREQIWEETNVAYPPRKGRQVGNVTLFLAIALVALSALLSSLSLPRILEWVSAAKEPVPAQEGSLAQSLGIRAVVTASPDVFEGVRRPGLPREKLIGSGPELSRQMVMTVEVENFPGIFKGRQVLPFYWRSFTYDIYTGKGWRTSSTGSTEYRQGQLIGPEEAPDHLLIQQTMRTTGAEFSSIYTAGEPVSANLPSLGAWRSPEDLFGIQVEGIASYQARSLFPVAGEGVLRTAGQRYPDWVREHYLALPPDVPGRVIELAFNLTASEPNPYDRARAIEHYLREIPYTLDVPYPPLDQDLVDFFLFDLRQGYCDYYASAMVVLARAAGIPARIAIGYASGTYDLNTKRFHVTEAEAHTWVEVYFPDIGWVPFEPTAARPFLGTNQSQAALMTQNMKPDEERSKEPGVKSVSDVGLIIIGVLAAVGISVAVWAVVDEFRLRRLSEPGAARVVYRRMRRYTAHLGAAPDPGDTPLEVAASLISQIQQFSTPGSEQETTVKRSKQVNSLVENIVKVSYHPHPDLENFVYSQWKSLRWQLRLVWLRRRYLILHNRVRAAWMSISQYKYDQTVQEA